MSLPLEHIGGQMNAEPHDIVYLAKHPYYEVALSKLTPARPYPGQESPMVQLRFTNQPHRQGIVLTLDALEQFHDALSQLIDYVKREHERRGQPSSRP
jgi:hypothetical protein